MLYWGLIYKDKEGKKRDFVKIDAVAQKMHYRVTFYRGSTVHTIFRTSAISDICLVCVLYYFSPRVATQGKPEFMGRTKAQPMVKLDPSDARTPVLQWYKITRHEQDGGELLAAFELIKVGLKILTSIMLWISIFFVFCVFIAENSNIFS